MKNEHWKNKKETFWGDEKKRQKKTPTVNDTKVQLNVGAKNIL